MLRPVIALILITLVSTTAQAGDNDLPPNPDAAAHCRADSGCPTHYDRIYPYLAHFCAGTLTEEHTDQLGAMALETDLDKSAFEALFNAYGAMYGYEFKMLKKLNAFFYDAAAAKWLPASCASKIKSKKSAKDMPFKLTQQRDQLRRIYDFNYKDQKN